MDKAYNKTFALKGAFEKKEQLDWFLGDYLRFISEVRKMFDEKTFSIFFDKRKQSVGVSRDVNLDLNEACRQIKLRKKWVLTWEEHESDWVDYLLQEDLKHA